MLSATRVICVWYPRTRLEFLTMMKRNGGRREIGTPEIAEFYAAADAGDNTFAFYLMSQNQLMHFLIIIIYPFHLKGRISK